MNLHPWLEIASGGGRPDVLWEDGERRFCRVRHSGTGVPHEGIAVVLAAERPAPGSVGRLVHEFALREHLDSAWALRPLDLVREHGRTVLVLEYQDGEPLDRLVALPMEMGRCLRLAAALAAAIGRQHDRGVVHKDIKPANVLVNAAGDRVWLTGFGVASRLPREHQSPEEPPEFIAGTFSHMSPEQTGRMNRSIDSRTDLYSLGVTLYQMLTGSLPFSAADPMAWVHCHVARRPAPPEARREDLPRPVSAIVMRLLAKTPEERYQTASGVERDLRHCLANWLSGRASDEFTLGERDRPERLLMPEHLYGREGEIESLLAAFDHVVAGGKPQLVLVAGPPGIGKSAVVNELHKVLVPPRGLFASGKFDQLKRDVPYATVAEAFQKLVRNLLSRPEPELRQWRDDLRQALDPNAALVVELIPELKFVIGEQGEVPDLDSSTAKARYQMALRRLIGVFARAEHPLALFLDDLQWLDTATLDLLEDLLVQPDLQHLLLIGAYRDNEVDSQHPLARMLAAVRSAGDEVRELVLAPLKPRDLCQLIGDALHCDGQRAMPLAQVVHDRTGGNPFFANQFIRTLVEDGSVCFDAGDGTWSWDLGSIRAQGYADSAADLMIAKLKRLPLTTQEALMDLACLGGVVQASTLSIVQGSSQEEVHTVLWEALCSELLVRSNDSYRFAHDRIHEAAYSLIPEEQRAQGHLRIGKVLAARREGAEQAIFDIVGQLNRGSALLESPEERWQVAELNLIAGKRAKSAAAYDSSLNYLIAASSLVGSSAWESRREFCFQLELHRAECEFLTGQLGAAAQRIEGLGLRAVDSVERARVACLSIDVHTALDQSDRAVAVCLEYLRRIGVDWPVHPNADEALREYERIRTRTRDVSIRDLVDMPLIADPVCLATLDVLAKTITPAFFTDPSLLALLVCRMVNISLEAGNSDASCFGYVWFGHLAGPHFGDYEFGFQLAQMGHAQVQTRGLRRFEAATNMCFAHGVMPWFEDFRLCCEMTRRTFAAAYRSGDLNYAAYSCNALVTDLLAAGEELGEVQREAEHGLGFASRAKLGLVIDVITAQLALVRTLRGQTPRFGRFDDGKFDEARFEDHLGSAANLALPECWYWVRKLQARFLAGEYSAAVDAATHAGRLMWTSTSMPESAEYHYFAALAHAALCESESVERYKSHLEALAAHHAQLGTWAQHCPGNFETRAALVAAEIARIEGRTIEAETLYERAIHSASSSGLVHNEALANEMAANFYARRGFDRIARMYLRDARAGYLQWGADGKARQLEDLHPHLVDTESRPDSAYTLQTSVDRLDLETVLKVLQTLSSVTDPGRLITAIMRLGLEYAGADRGLLILPISDGFQVEAEANVSGEGVSVLLQQTPVSPEKLPESIFHYVLRTGENIQIQDASSDNPFSADAYLRGHRPRSVVCLPLVKQTGLVGLIYLENSQVPGVFTPVRMAVLKLLASEAALSLENSRLYRDLQMRESRVRRLVDSNIIGIVIWHADGRILDTNDAFLRIVGYDREDLVSGRVLWTDLTPPEWSGRDAQTLEHLREVGKVQAHEREYIKKDGSRVPVLAAGATFDGTPEEGVAFVLDLTERKRAEDAQREIERESRLIVDTIPGLIAVLSAGGEVEFVNRQVVEYRGTSMEDLAGWKIEDEVHPEDLPVVNAAFAHAIESGDPYNLEMRLRRSDGTFRWFKSRASPFRSSNGGVVRWYLLLTDIDERKRAEEALVASERNLRLIIDTIPAMAWSAHAEGSADYFNQRFLDFAGLQAARASDWGWAAAVHPDDLHGLMTVWRRIMASEAPGAAEARLRRYDGAYRWFLIRMNPLCDDDGKLVKWYGVNTDIEDHKRAEAELRRAYDSFADAQRLSRTGNFTADIVADEHVWSAELFRVFEMDPATRVTVQAVRDRIHPEDLPAFDAGFAHSLGGADFDLAFRIVTPKGNTKHVHAVGRLTELVAGRPLFIGAIQDVTERKLAEDALNRARSDLAHVARITMLSTLTASIAHEVNQPLSGIITNAGTCLRMLDADPPNIDGARETARRITRDGSRASDVIVRLRALFSKKEFTLESVDLNEAIREVIALTLSDLQRNRVTLVYELSDDLPRVAGDRVQLQQVVLNLLRNASDAMVGVDDRPRQVRVSTERDGEDHVRVKVQDAGVGIDRENLDKIFEPFYTTKSGGMGIGLSISRSIVERHHGRLTAEPNDGPGATFLFSIPSAPRGPGDTEDATAGARDGQEVHRT